MTETVIITYANIKFCVNRFLKLNKAGQILQICSSSQFVLSHSESFFKTLFKTPFILFLRQWTFVSSESEGTSLLHCHAAWPRSLLGTWSGKVTLLVTFKTFRFPATTCDSRKVCSVAKMAKLMFRVVDWGDMWKVSVVLGSSGVGSDGCR